MNHRLSAFREVPLQYWSEVPIVNGVGEAANEERRDWPRYVRTTDLLTPRALNPKTFKSLAPEIAARAPLRKGDLVITAAGTCGKSHLYSGDSPACFAGYLVRVRPAPHVDGRFLAYWTESRHFTSQVAQGVVRSTIENFSAGKYRKVKVPSPPRDTQRAIADFLDRKTAAIDALIAKKERLLTLLAEKRAALIHQAVTKGLDPNVPMKDTGIPWIGEIPAHWGVRRLGHCIRRTGGIQMGPFGGMLKDVEYEETPFRLYGQVNTIADDFGIGTRWLSEQAYQRLSRYWAEPGDILLTRKGASIGHARCFPDDADPGAIDSDTIRVRVNPVILVGELALLLLNDADYVAEQIGVERRGAILPNLNSSRVARLSLAVPPPEEQSAVIEAAQRAAREADGAGIKIREQLFKLREYRQALITAAVTGQLDIEGAA